MSSIKRPYLRGKQTQILGGQQRGNGSAKMISMAMQKFIKYEKRLRKEGNMLGLPINNNQAKSLPLQREI
jgi:hypothetical protein